MSYFEDGDTVPPPFNMVPTGKTFTKILKCGKSGRATRSVIVCIIAIQLILRINEPMHLREYLRIEKLNVGEIFKKRYLSKPWCKRTLHERKQYITIGWRDMKI